MHLIASIKIIAPMLFYAFGIFLAIFAIFGKPQWTLLLYVFLIPLRNIIDKVQTFPMGNQLLDILIAGMLLSWFLSAGSSTKKFMESSPLNVSGFILIFYTLLSVFIGSYYIDQNGIFTYDNSRITDAKNFCLLPITFLLTLNHIQEKKWVWLVFWAMCAAMLLMGYYTIGQVSMYSSLLSRAKITGSFQFLGPNEVAAFYNQITIILLGVYFFMKKGWPKLILLGLILINLYCILFLFSRGAYLGLAVGLFIMFCFKNRKFLIPFFLILAFWQVVLPEKAIQRIQSTHSETGNLDESSERRINIWKQSLNLFYSSPIFGIGYGVFRYLNFDLGDTHNIYVKLLAEQGIVGLLIFFIVVFCFMKEGFGLYQKGEDGFSKGLGLGLFVCMFVLLINNMFGDRWSYFELSGYLWVFAGLAARLKAIDSKEGHTAETVSTVPVKQKRVTTKPVRKSYYK